MTGKIFLSEHADVIKFHIGKKRRREETKKKKKRGCVSGTCKQERFEESEGLREGVVWAPVFRTKERPSWVCNSSFLRLEDFHESIKTSLTNFTLNFGFYAFLLHSSFQCLPPPHSSSTSRFLPTSLPPFSSPHFLHRSVPTSTAFL